MERFLVVFCEGEILCDGKEPNWLGLAVLGIVVVVGTALILNLATKFFSKPR